MVDRDLLLRKLAALDQYVGQVSEFRDITVEQYRRDWKIQRIIERTLQMAIEACVDISNHMIADRALRVPTSVLRSATPRVSACWIAAEAGKTGYSIR